MIEDKALNPHYDETYYRSHYAASHADDHAHQLMGEYYRHSVFDRLAPGAGRILDYGCGLGHLTISMGADCYDPSPYARGYLKSRGRSVYESVEEIPTGSYGVLFCSHAMEHAESPPRELETMRSLLAPGGILILLLPVEPSPGTPVTVADDNLHFYCWNFQTLTNLLLHKGFSVRHQEVFYGPFLLRTMGRWFAPATAARWAYTFGQRRRTFPSILAVACPT